MGAGRQPRRVRRAAALAGEGGHERGLVGVEEPGGEAPGHPLDEPGAGGVQRAVGPRRAQIGKEPVLGVELAPAARRRPGGGGDAGGGGSAAALRRPGGRRRPGPQRQPRRPHPARVLLPARRRRAVLPRPGGVRARQRPAEGPRGGRRRARLAQARLLQPALAAPHRHHRGSAVGHRLGQPDQAQGLQARGAGGGVVLADHGGRGRAHGASLPRPGPTDTLRA